MKKAFTIMELLVSIAIITLIMTVVIVAVDSTRNRGSDTNIQATLGQIRAETVLYRETKNGSFADICSATGEYRVFEQRAEACFQAGYSISDPACKCYASENSWVITVPLKTEKYGYAWCVDSNNYGGPIDLSRFSSISATTLCQ